MLSVSIHQQIVKLQISVYIALCMHVANALDQLFEDHPAGVLWQSLVRHFLYVVENRHTTAKLHHEMDLGSLVYHFVQLHNVWMPHV